MAPQPLRAGSVVFGPVLPEPIEIIAVTALGDAVRLFGKGLRTGLARHIVLSSAQQARLVVSADQPPFDGDARLFRLGVEAQRLGLPLAYEYDPFFSLSIARVDPLPDDFDDLTEEEQQEIVAQLEDVVASYNPADLRDEIAQLAGLIDRAKRLEQREGESKLVKLKAILSEQHVFSDPKTKLLVFTEHKDSLDFLVGDGQDGRPLGKLREWGLSVTQIHGGMTIGDRDAVGTRIWAEREFRENAQVMVATEAAGEGINLQFCWLMVNFDIR